MISTVWDLIKNDILEQARSEFLENSNYEEYQRLAKVFASPDQILSSPELFCTFLKLHFLQRHKKFELAIVEATTPNNDDA